MSQADKWRLRAFAPPAVSLLAVTVLHTPASAGVSPTVADEAVAAVSSGPIATPGAAVTERRVIGSSVRDRPIVARRYGPADATHVGVIIAEIHGTERAGRPIARRLRQLGAPGKTAMWIIPTVNPDGHVARQRKNARGVDLNRNGPHLWKGTARAPDYYPGRWAMSEPETRAYMQFLEGLDPDLVLIYHQAGNGVDSYRAKNMVIVRGLAKRMKMAPKSFSCDGECTGTLTGWFNSTHAGAAITVELPASVTAAKTRRWAMAARWAIKSVPDDRSRQDAHDLHSPRSGKA